MVNDPPSRKCSWRISWRAWSWAEVWLMSSKGSISCSAAVDTKRLWVWVTMSIKQSYGPVSLASCAVATSPAICDFSQIAALREVILASSFALWEASRHCSSKIRCSLLHFCQKPLRFERSSICSWTLRDGISIHCWKGSDERRTCGRHPKCFSSCLHILPSARRSWSTVHLAQPPNPTKSVCRSERILLSGRFLSPQAKLWRVYWGSALRRRESRDWSTSWCWGGKGGMWWRNMVCVATDSEG